MTNRLISCDDHMDLSQLAADLWTTRLPASLLDRAPHVEERDGQAVWVCDGKVWGRWDSKAPATGSARAIKPLEADHIARAESRRAFNGRRKAVTPLCDTPEQS